MKKRTSITLLVIIGTVLVIGLILAFCSFNIGLTKYTPFAKKIKLGLDLKGGVYAVYEADMNDTENIDSRMEGTRSSIESLLLDKGYPEATVTREGNYKIRVEVPDVADPSALLKLLGEPAKLRFELEDGNSAIVDGKVKKAEAAYYQGSPIVSIEFDSVGAKEFGVATANNIGKTIKIIVIRGDDQTTVSEPKVESAITGGSAMITNMESYAKAEELANQIMSGTFDVSLSLKESSTVSATLGDKAITYGLIAGIIGLILVFVMLIVLYGLNGVMGSIVLLIYSVVMLYLLAVFPWVQLTLPGIAGILLSIGMAVDGNIVIYEAVKNEYRNGKSIMSAFHYGYKKSIMTIVDGNVTTILAAIVLLLLGTGSVKGFAITLLMGLLLAVVSSLGVTKLLMNIAISLNRDKPNLYRLKRSSAYMNLKADENDAAVQMALDKEKADKEAKALARRKDSENMKGGVV